MDVHSSAARLIVLTDVQVASQRGPVARRTKNDCMNQADHDQNRAKQVPGHRRHRRWELRERDHGFVRRVRDRTRIRTAVVSMKWNFGKDARGLTGAGAQYPKGIVTVRTDCRYDERKLTELTAAVLRPKRACEPGR